MVTVYNRGRDLESRLLGVSNPGIRILLLPRIFFEDGGKSASLKTRANEHRNTYARCLWYVWNYTAR